MITVAYFNVGRLVHSSYNSKFYLVISNNSKSNPRVKQAGRRPLLTAAHARLTRLLSHDSISRVPNAAVGVAMMTPTVRYDIDAIRVTERQLRLAAAHTAHAMSMQLTTRQTLIASLRLFVVWQIGIEWTLLASSMRTSLEIGNCSTQIVVAAGHDRSLDIGQRSLHDIDTALTQTLDRRP